MSPTRIDQAALIQYLRLKSGFYHGKLLELREAVDGWLAYIPQTFPHYTRHTIQHSDEIIIQISKLLFREEDPAAPVVGLSSIEAYVLAAAAYLHDAGMVASDFEKRALIRSDAWLQWISGSGGGAKRWADVQAFRAGSIPPGETERHFIADYETRFLVAEFVRRNHHLRAADVIAQHQTALARFALDDPMLQRTISDVCVGHGLRPHELDDHERYPERRDIRGEAANIRFLAIILRLGDLLDMSSDRACPLLLNAACPLPADSMAHWTQYKQITHRLTAPDEIAITAECQTQSEHRVLQDWCQWIVDEVRHARVSMARAMRHGSWRSPRVGFEAPEATIDIRPAREARYIPSKWILELDKDAVLDRLIHDVYDDPFAFIRELVQNALDAMRCRMYADLVAEGIDPPEYPTQVDESRRQRYPLELRIEHRDIVNDLSGEPERQQLLVVDDCGIGMDKGVIERFFLQVGRSYYTTEEFRRTFRFLPTSRFGVGFLSVFAVSDYVAVETYRPKRSPAPLRLVLTGPRNYLLTERGSRRGPGTKIEVALREPLDPGQLTTAVTRWCRRVEFPIVVHDLDRVTTVRAEAPSDFTYEMRDISATNSRFVIRTFPANRPGIEGEFYVFARVNDEGESWADWSWAHYSYPQLHPQAETPPSIGSCVCVHGIANVTGGDLEPGGYHGGGMSMRVDYRGAGYGITLTRSGERHGRIRRPMNPALASRWHEILNEHLATTSRANGPKGWEYKQRLVDIFDFPDFWESVPQTITFYSHGRPQRSSLRDLLADAGVVVTVLRRGETESWRRKGGQEEYPLPPEVAAYDRVFRFYDLNALSNEHRKAIFRGRSIVNVTYIKADYLVVEWSLPEEVPTTSSSILSNASDKSLMLVDLAREELVGGELHRTIDATYSCVAMNRRNPLVRWVLRMREACSEGQHGLKWEQYTTLLSLLDKPLRYGGHELSYFVQYVRGWREIAGLTGDLLPPDVELTSESFSVWPLKQRLPSDLTLEVRPRKGRSDDPRQ